MAAKELGLVRQLWLEVPESIGGAHGNFGIQNAPCEKLVGGPLMTLMHLVVFAIRATHGAKVFPSLPFSAC